jgi:hypothetical protein
VLERSLADALGIRVGTHVNVSTQDGLADLQMRDTAVSPAQPWYPRSNPGLAWVTRAVLEQVEPDRGRWRWMQAVRLHDPAAAAPFAAHAAARLPAAAAPDSDVSLETWQHQRDDALLDAQPTQLVLTTFAILLLIVAFFVVAILFSARAGQQRRVIGLLKAAGLTPRQVGAVFALESVALGLVAIALGFVLGTTLAPRLAAPSAETLLGSPTIATSPWHILIASGLVLPVLLASALTSSRRSARFTVVEAIHTGDVSPVRSPLARAVIRPVLPMTLALGLGDLLARGRRALLPGGRDCLDRLCGGGCALAQGDPRRTAGRRGQRRPRRAATPRLHTRHRPARDHAHDARRRRSAVGARAHFATSASSRQSVSRRVRSRRRWSVPTRRWHSSRRSSRFRSASGSTSYSVRRPAANTTDAVVAPWLWLAVIPIATMLVVVAVVGLPARLAARIRTAEALRFE